MKKRKLPPIHVMIDGKIVEVEDSVELQKLLAKRANKKEKSGEPEDR